MPVIANFGQGDGPYLPGSGFTGVGNGNSANTVASNVGTHGGKGRSLDGGSAASISSPSGGVSSNYSDLLKQISDDNNAFNLQQINAVNDFNAKEAQKNRDWQERMSNTAHQREVADLLAAGLNPVLSAGGQGAFTGTGAQASGHYATADNTYGQGMISQMTAMIGAMAAMSAAQISANATMYNADKTYEGTVYKTEANKTMNKDDNLNKTFNKILDVISPASWRRGSYSASNEYNFYY